jgi:hypothetical protein
MATNLVSCRRIVSQVLEDFVHDHDRPDRRAISADNLLRFPAEKLLNKRGKWSNVRRCGGLEKGQLGNCSDSRAFIEVDNVWIRERVRE